MLLAHYPSGSIITARTSTASGFPPSFTVGRQTGKAQLCNGELAGLPALGERRRLPGNTIHYAAWFSTSASTRQGPLGLPQSALPSFTVNVSHGSIVPFCCSARESTFFPSVAGFIAIPPVTSRSFSPLEPSDIAYIIGGAYRIVRV